MARGRKESVQAKEAIATGEGLQAKLHWNLPPVMTFEQRQKKVDEHARLVIDWVLLSIGVQAFGSRSFAE